MAVPAGGSDTVNGLQNAPTIIWRNMEFRRNILLHSDNETLVNVMTLSKEEFKEVLPILWYDLDEQKWKDSQLAMEPEDKEEISPVSKIYP